RALRPGDRYRCALARAFARGADRRAGQLDEPLDDVEPQARSGRRPSQLVAEAVKLLEDHRGVLGREAEPVVAHAEADAAPAARGGGGAERLGGQVAPERGRCGPVDVRTQGLVDVGVYLDAVQRRPFGDLGDRGVDGCPQRYTVAVQRMAAFLEPRRLEQIVD